MKKSRLLILSLVIALATSVFSMTLVSAAKLYGDLNQDGSIDALDYALMKGYLLGGTELPNSSVADLDADGNINAIDYSLLKQYLLKVIDKFPADVPEEEVKKTEAEKLVGDIIFSVPSSTFKNSLSVALSTKISNAQIRYTTNGSVPTASSQLYSNAISLTKTTQVRAQAFVNGAASGDIGTAVYICSSIDANHDLPVLILDSYGAGKPGKEDYLDAAIMLMEPKNNQSTLLQTPTVATRGGYHVRGQSSANFEKTPYRIEFWDNEGGDAKYPVMGLPADGDWCLLSPYPDKSLIRNAFAYEIGNDIGLEAPGYTFVEVYINIDNQPLSAADYQGVYLLTETIEIDKDRLNIKKLKEDDLTEPKISGGYLMQFNMQCAEEPLIKGSGWSDLELTEPKDVKSEQLTWITNYIQKVHNSIHSSNPSDQTTGYPAYIDVDSFVNFIIVNEMAREGDAYMRSTRLYKDRNEKLKAGPLWDYDLGFECYTGFGFGGTTSTVEGWQFQPVFGTNSTCDWYYTLMKDSSFQAKIDARWKELRKGPLSDANLTAKIQSLTTPLKNGAKRNFQKWNILNTSMVGGFGTQTTQTWEEQITILQNFVLQRVKWLDNSGWKPTTSSNPWGW
ncbi:dockerin type I repeat protein [Ruminiclostridium sufflavum DSM 19573]|uniref:cellulase n=1 Tax=Ruminiclostridium sufflavum DSM 19573 TaxID=1121337 RepID=A0A318XJZ5_9FIRM|nr:CotH kinase family protein [Ruminiclostridium sufflavum]PYG86856.1 dockerin type I repeat protein [Ruminiclostridium sufflavum DSM 19573]